MGNFTENLNLGNRFRPPLAESWIMTNKIQKQLDGCYTRMLSAAFNISWKDKKTNQELYGYLPYLSDKIKERILRFAGYCRRSQ